MPAGGLPGLAPIGLDLSGFSFRAGYVGALIVCQSVKRPSGPTAKQLLALGLVTFRFGGLESTAASVVWALLGTSQEKGRVMTDDLRFGLLVDKIRALVRVAGLEKPLLDRWEAWCTQAKQASQQRNELIHSVWLGGGGPPGELMRVRRGRRMEMVTDERKMLAVAEEIDRCAVVLVRLIPDTYGLLA